MLWSLLGLFLMGIGFPKCWLTERKRPYPAQHAHDPDRSWTHNCKDDFTDNFDDRMGGDREYWLKFMSFWLLFFMALSGVLAIVICVQRVVQ